jgi:hypothetical protein
VGVDVQRHLNLAVPEALRDHMHRLACLQQKRGAGVSEAMEFDPSHAGLPN